MSNEIINTKLIINVNFIDILPYDHHDKQEWSISCELKNNLRATFKIYIIR